MLCIAFTFVGCGNNIVVSTEGFMGKHTYEQAKLKVVDKEWTNIKKFNSATKIDGNPFFSYVNIDVFLPDGKVDSLGYEYLANDNILIVFNSLDAINMGLKVKADNFEDYFSDSDFSSELSYNVRWYLKDYNLLKDTSEVVYSFAYTMIEKRKYLNVNNHIMNKYSGKCSFYENKKYNVDANCVLYVAKSNKADAYVYWAVLDLSEDQSKGDLIDIYADTIACSLQEYELTE